MVLAPVLAPLAGVFGSAGSVPVDVVTQATPLALLQQGQQVPVADMLLAHPGAALGETSALALLLGGAYLIYRGHINWRIPAAVLGTVFVLTLVVGENPVYHILANGLLLGAFFMATDWVTSPITSKGKVVFGVGIGMLVVLFRVFLPPTEGVAFSILIMNALVPTIERFTKRIPFAQPRAAKIASGQSAQA